MEKFVFYSEGQGGRRFLFNLSQVAYIELESDRLFVYFAAGGKPIVLTGAAAVELRKTLSGATMMTNGVPMPADFSL